MAAAKTVRYRWTGEFPVQTEQGVVQPGGYLTVKAEDTAWFDSLDGWVRAPARKRKKPAAKK